MRNTVTQEQPEILTNGEISNSGKSKLAVWLAIPGFLFLGASVSSLQNIAERFATRTERNYDLFIANWMPWVAISCFALGWLITHWLEIAVSEKRSRFSRVLFGIMIFGGGLLAAYLQFMIGHEVLAHFGTTSIILIMAGYLLRLSMFRNANYLLLRHMIFNRAK